MLNCLLISECVYKGYDLGTIAAAAAFCDLKQLFPPGLITVDGIQWALPHVPHRCAKLHTLL